MSSTKSASNGLWAVVPVKNLGNAKTRLANALSLSERQQLFQAMLQDVLQTLSESRELAGLLVVTCDEEAASIARDYGARILAEKENLGHTAASTLGAQTLAREKKTGMLQVPADIPLVSPADIATLVEVHGTAPAITLAPSRDRTGSNAVLCSPADILPLQFGDYSFPPHIKKSQELGIEPVVVDRPGLGLDIDTPDDLVALLRTPSQTRSYRYLLTSGIGQRLLDDAADSLDHHLSV